MAFSADYVAQEDLRSGRLTSSTFRASTISHPNYVCYRADARGPVLSLIETLVESRRYRDD